MQVFLSFPKMSFSTEECIILLMWNSRTGKTNYGDSSQNSGNTDWQGLQLSQMLLGMCLDLVMITLVHVFKYKESSNDILKVSVLYCV